MIKVTAQALKNQNIQDTTQWELVVQGANKAKWYLNKIPIIAIDGHVRAWVKIIGSSITIKRKIYKDVEELWLMDFFCNKQTTQVVQLVAYNSKGEQLLDDRKTYPEINIIPDSVIDDIAQIACYNFKK